MADAMDVHLFKGTPMQPLEKSHVLNLHCGLKALAAPAVGRRDRFPDQSFADLVVAAE